MRTLVSLITAGLLMGTRLGYTAWLCHTNLMELMIECQGVEISEVSVNFTSQGDEKVESC